MENNETENNTSEETEVNLEDCEEKIQALVEAGLVEKEEIDDIEQSAHDDNLFKIGDREYLVCTDDEADQLWEQSLGNYIDECILPELPEIAKNYFDEEKWKSDARVDGRGHSLAGYDGEEHEAKIGDTWYYVYRQN